MEFIIIGLAVAFNIIIIKTKIEKGRKEDAFFDACCLVAITMVFSGSFGGLVVGTIASAFISFYLLASPPTFLNGMSTHLNKFTSKAKKKGNKCNSYNL
jgi:hypothetical protein